MCQGGAVSVWDCDTHEQLLLLDAADVTVGPSVTVDVVRVS